MFFIPLYTQSSTGNPVFAGTILDITGVVGGQDIEIDFSGYFTDATSYAINSLEDGWSFNTSTGVLTIDTDYGNTGPYMITGINGTNEAYSNEFYVLINFGAATAAGNQRAINIINTNRNIINTPQNRVLSTTNTNRKLL